MPRIVLACIVAIFAITTYRCIMVHAQTPAPAPSGAMVDTNLNALVNSSNNNSADGNNTQGVKPTTIAGIAPDMTCPSAPNAYPADVKQCLSNKPGGNFTLAATLCTIVDSNPTICACASLTNNNTAVASVSAAQMVYIPYDTCTGLGGPNACDCVKSSGTNSTGAGGAAKAAGKGSGSTIAAAPALLLGSVLAALLTKMFP